MAIRVLLLEDDAADQVLLVNAVAECGLGEFDVVTAASPAAAEELLRETWDLFVLDMEFGHFKELESLEWLLGHGVTAPIVCWTGHIHLNRAALRYGASWYTVKEANPRELVAVLRNLYYQALARERSVPQQVERMVGVTEAVEQLLGRMVEHQAREEVWQGDIARAVDAAGLAAQTAAEGVATGVEALRGDYSDLADRIKEPRAWLSNLTTVMSKDTTWRVILAILAGIGWLRGLDPPSWMVPTSP